MEITLNLSYVSVGFVSSFVKNQIGSRSVKLLKAMKKEDRYEFIYETWKTLINLLDNIDGNNDIKCVSYIVQNFICATKNYSYYNTDKDRSEALQQFLKFALDTISVDKIHIIFNIAKAFNDKNCMILMLNYLKENNIVNTDKFDKLVEDDFLSLRKILIMYRYTWDNFGKIFLTTPIFTSLYSLKNDNEDSHYYYYFINNKFNKAFRNTFKTVQEYKPGSNTITNNIYTIQTNERLSSTICCYTFTSMSEDTKIKFGSKEHELYVEIYKNIIGRLVPNCNTKIIKLALLILLSYEIDETTPDYVKEFLAEIKTIVVKEFANRRSLNNSQTIAELINLFKGSAPTELTDLANTSKVKARNVKKLIVAADLL